MQYFKRHYTRSLETFWCSITKDQDASPRFYINFQLQYSTVLSQLLCNKLVLPFTGLFYENETQFYIAETEFYKC